MTNEMMLLSLEELQSQKPLVAEKAKSVCYLTLENKKGEVVQATGFYAKKIDENNKTISSWIITCSHFISDINATLFVKFPGMPDPIEVNDLKGYTARLSLVNRPFGDVAMIRIHEIKNLTPVMEIQVDSATNRLSFRETGQANKCMGIYALHYGAIKEKNVRDSEIFEKLENKTDLKVTKSLIDKEHKDGGFQYGLSYKSYAGIGSSGGCILSSTGKLMGIMFSMAKKKKINISYATSVSYFKNFLRDLHQDRIFAWVKVKQYIK